MIEKDQLKNEGATFGRNLHKALKIASMYASVDHAAADMAAQQAFGSLGLLLKHGKEFTLGFMNGRLLLNNVLTGDNPLEGLEAEFTKRGMRAVSFEAGITYRDFKRGLELLAVSPKVLEKGGGLKRFLDHNPLHRVRILPATKSPTAGEDVVLPGPSESYLMAQAILEPQAGAEDAALDMILQATGVGPAPASLGSPAEVRQVTSKAIQRVLEDPERDLQAAIETLTRLFKQLTPEYLLAAASPEKQAQMRGRSAEELVTDLVEDVGVDLAGKRLAAAPPGPLSPELLQEVVGILTRGLRATRVAERLLQKLARFIEEAKLPAEIHDRIRQELDWLILSDQEKHARLLRLERFEDKDFRRLVNYIHDRMKETRTDVALEVTNHYFATLDKVPADVAVEQMRRAPELLRAVAGPATPEFLAGLATRFCPQLSNQQREPEFHRQVAECLIAVAQNAALYEDFGLVQRIGEELQGSLATDPARHTECCGAALKRLLTATAADRLVELYFENREDSNWSKTVARLLRLSGTAAIERAFERLSEEPAAANRLRLIRLIEHLGPAAIESARKRLNDERWYVVRNACYFVGRLGDPDIPNQLRAALRHPEVRVQQAAVTALVKSQVAGRAPALAEALPHLKAHALEVALDELIFLKDAVAVQSLESFLLQKKGAKVGELEKAVRVLAAIPSDQAVEVLGRVLGDQEQPRSVRRAALVALSCSTSPHAHRLMFRFSRQEAKDDLVEECRALLNLSQR